MQAIRAWITLRTSAGSGRCPGWNCPPWSRDPKDGVSTPWRRRQSLKGPSARCILCARGRALLGALGAVGAAVEVVPPPGFPGLGAFGAVGVCS